MYTTCSGEAVRGGGVCGAGERNDGVAPRAAFDSLRRQRLGQSPTPRYSPLVKKPVASHLLPVASHLVPVAGHLVLVASHLLVIASDGCVAGWAMPAGGVHA